MCFKQAILVWSLVTFSAPTYGSVLYPTWGTAVGWCMIIFCVIWIPIVAVVKILKAEGNLFQVRAQLSGHCLQFAFHGIVGNVCAFFLRACSVSQDIITWIFTPKHIFSSYIRGQCTQKNFPENLYLYFWNFASYSSLKWASTSSGVCSSCQALQEESFYSQLSQPVWLQ